MNIFHPMENAALIFPHCGKLFSTLWKNLVPALLAGTVATARAALPEPPDLPFPLPAADLAVRQTATFYTTNEFLHVATLNRPLAGFELDDFSAALAGRNWTPQVVDPARSLAVLGNLQALAPSPDLQQPFIAAQQLIQEGLKSWTLDEIQLMYSPGENATLSLTFPLPSNAVPNQVGTFTADLPLPLNDAAFSQAAIQAEDSQITRMESWSSNETPDLFLPQAEQILIGAGWTPPDAPVLPSTNPGNQDSRNRLALLEIFMKNAFRVYHREASQLTILHIPADPANPTGAAHNYILVLRTILQWPQPSI